MVLKCTVINNNSCFNLDRKLTANAIPTFTPGTYAATVNGGGPGDNSNSETPWSLSLVAIEASRKEKEQKL